MPAPGLALIDYYNFRTPEAKSRADLELETETVLDEVVGAFGHVFPGTAELDVRLYGGWTDESGSPTADAAWLLQLLPALRGRRHGVIVRPSLATAMIRFPEFLLRGTLRGQGRNRRQKMVDAMMGVDAMYMASEGMTCLGIVTNDDDLLPAAVTAHDINGEVLAWIRARPAGSALNDRVLLEKGLRIHDMRSWVDDA